MNKDELKSIIYDQNENLLNEEFVDRTLISTIAKYKSDKFIIILTGLRRVGKSTILKKIKEIDKTQFNYINFDDFRLINFNINDFSKLDEIFLELNGTDKIFYFDEIQNVLNWERYIRTLHDKGKKVYLTGSNAAMLSSELSTHLTGRNITLNVFPFSFKEFLLLKGVKVTDNFLLSMKNKVQVIKLFDIYLKQGGIPDYLKTGKSEFLQYIYEDIINRDIVNRYQITNIKSLKDLLYFLISNIGKEFSYNKLKALIGVKNPTTVKDYISYFENSYLLFTINKFDYSLKKQMANPKKVYCIDNGIANNISFKFSENLGRFFENLVFIELKRRNYNIFYHRFNHECDFLIFEKGKIISAIQVCRSLSDLDTRKREFDGLIDAMSAYSLNEGMILTEDEEFSEKISDKKGNFYVVKVMPVWKWLLIE